MAKKAKTPSKKIATNSRRGSSQFLLWTIAIAGLAVIALPSVILVFFAMIPTMAAFLVDRTPHRYTTMAVGAMNFSGAFPFLMMLWDRHNTAADAAAILTNPLYLTVMYGAAGFGWLLFLSIPPFVITMVNMSVNRQKSRLRKEQKSRIAEWGPEVDGDAINFTSEPVDQVK